MCKADQHTHRHVRVAARRIQCQLRPGRRLLWSVSVSILWPVSSQSCPMRIRLCLTRGATSNWTCITDLHDVVITQSLGFSFWTPVLKVRYRKSVLVEVSDKNAGSWGSVTSIACCELQIACGCGAADADRLPACPPALCFELHLRTDGAPSSSHLGTATWRWLIGWLRSGPKLNPPAR